MKKERRMLSFSVACIMIISFVFANVYAEDTGSKAEEKNTRSTVETIVEPVEGLIIDKTVKNVENFDIQNPEYQLDLTAKTVSDIVTSQVPCDIALILDTSGSMRLDMINIKSTKEVPKSLNMNKEYYINRSGDVNNPIYENVVYWPQGNQGKDCWLYYDGQGSHKVEYAIDGYGFKNNEGIEQHEFYELSYDSLRKEIYTPYVQYAIKLESGRITEVNGIAWNNGSNLWYYYEGANAVYVEPTQGTVSSGYKQYEFFEVVPKKKIEVLKQSATEFVKKIKSKSSESKIDIISFSGKVRNVTGGFTGLETEEDFEKVNKAIKNLQPQDITRTDLGIKEALKEIEPIKNNNRKKVVILFTDGRPTDNSMTTKKLIELALADADILKGKDINAVVYSIGIFNDEDFRDAEVQDFMRSLATANDESVKPPKKYFFNCMDVAELDKIFTEISLEAGLSLEKCKIKDYIDPKFTITEESIKTLRAKGAEVTTEVKDGVTYEVVIWTENIKPGTDGFKDSIIIKPKDSSVYGKRLPTNINGISAIYNSKGNNIGSFPLPNVDIINLAKSLNQEKTSIKLQPNNNIDRSYKITLTAWTNLEDIKIQDNIGVTDYELSGLKDITIKDYLDPRFEPTDQWLESIKGNENVEAISNIKGNWCIQWKNQFIPYMEKDNVSIDKWSKEIGVKAKDEFIGGNDIKTNISPDSGIYKDNRNLRPFSEPTVNVPVNLSIRNKNVSIFFGEKFPVHGVKEEMFTGENFNCFLGEEPTGKFDYQWFESNGVTTIKDLKDEASIMPSKDVDYKLRVRFIPYLNGDKSEKTNGGAKVIDTSVIGQYNIKVVTGQITVNKTIDTKDIWFPHGDPIFTLKLERLDDNEKVVETLYDVIRFEEKDNIYHGMTATKNISFNGLKKGRYRLSELDTLRYKFESNAVDTSKSCEAEKQGESIIFYMGYENKGNSTTNLNNGEGMGTFVNKKVNEKYFSHTDVVKNTFVIKSKSK
ncbi:MAG: VWA domain-containing protein [Clostridium sp.]